jgi:hypothetical protein
MTGPAEKNDPPSRSADRAGRRVAWTSAVARFLQSQLPGSDLHREPDERLCSWVQGPADGRCPAQQLLVHHLVFGGTPVHKLGEVSLSFG